MIYNSPATFLFFFFPLFICCWTWIYKTIKIQFSIQHEWLNSTMHYYKTALYTTIKNFPFPVGRLGATQQFTTPICVPKYNEDMAQSYLCEGRSEP